NDPRFRTADDRPWFDVAAIRAVENQQRPVVRISLAFIESNYQDVVYGIDRNGLGSRKLRVRTLDNANGSDVTIRTARIYADSSAVGHDHFIVDRVRIQTAAAGFDMRALEDSHRTFLCDASCVARASCFLNLIHD